MRILFLSTWFPHPPDNGSKVRVAYLLRALGRAHDVYLYSFAFATAKPADAETLLESCRRVEVVQSDPFATNRAGLLTTFLSASPRVTRPLPAMQKLVRNLLETQSFDVAIASTEVMACYALLAQPTTFKVLEEHNSLTRWMYERFKSAKGVLRRTRYWSSWQKMRRFEARLLGCFDLTTMVSSQDRAVSLQSLPGYSGNVAVVPNGTDCAYNYPGLALPHRDHLVFNGSLTYDANYGAMRWFLTDVYPLIRAHRPEVRLTITGSTAGTDLSALPLDTSVRLTGFVEDVRIPVAGAAVAVAPIRQGGGTRLKILEAMALGTPVVATTKGAEGLDVVDGEHLLLADTPQAFANAVLGLVTDSDERTRIAQNARSLVEARYDWSAIGERFVQLVEETVETRRGSSVRSALGRR